MGIWTAIKYVSSGITLVAFIVAVTAWVYRASILQKERQIRQAPESARGDLVESALEFFRVDTSGLSAKQQYDLALEQIHAKALRFRSTAIVVVIIAFFGAAVGVVAILKPGNLPVVMQPDPLANAASPTIEAISTQVKPTSIPLTPMPLPTTTDNQRSKKYTSDDVLPASKKYIVTVRFPSNMGDAEIKVDGKPANEIEPRGLIDAKIEVNSSATPHSIMLIKGGKVVCKEPPFILRSNIAISPCAK